METRFHLVLKASGYAATAAKRRAAGPEPDRRISGFDTFRTGRDSREAKGQRP
ncbi:MAG TPA: hypothetical protein H9717_03640 [Candidatus Eisenbergiella merdipullorum]|uniref:Uncharacterized protein n=1 Tax=Candidatus Eisenbergiella merdipullorum TaxID=2838553 RepID=A0A9D2I5G3_9FIRM|nr:hypothetical protein [Candidatus Eisenbergiella merdipullorum]